jgi:arginyl-tRNA synthetase
LKEALNLEGNSGPYLQYTYARCRSVLRKAKFNHLTIQPFSHLTIQPKELAILRSLYKFPEVVLETGKTYSPNLICNFLFDLAQKYNTFYNKHKIIGGENENLRLTITAATAQVLKNGLRLLGIKTLKRM